MFNVSPKEKKVKRRRHPGLKSHRKTGELFSNTWNGKEEIIYIRLTVYSRSLVAAVVLWILMAQSYQSWGRMFDPRFSGLLAETINCSRSFLPLQPFK